MSIGKTKKHLPARTAAGKGEEKQEGGNHGIIFTTSRAKLAPFKKRLFETKVSRKGEIIRLGGKI